MLAGGHDDVRPAGPGDLADIVAVMTRAFHGDPGALIIEPDASLRDAAMSALFHVFVAAALVEATSILSIGDPLAGVAIWFGPDHHRPSEGAVRLASSVRGAPTMSTAAGARRDAMRNEMESLHRRSIGDEPHLRLDFLAVDPAAQGRGLGSRLLAVGNRAADERGLPVYLDTFTLPDVRFYERRGYRVIEEHPMAARPFTVWAMRREPASQA